MLTGKPRRQTATGSFNVQVAIAATCVVTNAATLDFGTQGVLATNVDQTSTINVTCTNTTPYNIGLDKGLNGASVTTRQMKAGAALINYSLLDDELGQHGRHGHRRGHRQRLGAGVHGLRPHSAANEPGRGTYTDTITVTVTY